MNVENIIDLLLSRKVLIKLVNNELKVKAKPGVLDQEIISLIKDNKQDLVEYLRQRESTVSAENTKITRRPKGISIPLSFSQQRLWLIDKLYGASSEYILPCVLKVAGQFDLDIAEKAINRILDRHESLRTSFREVDGETVQVVNQEYCFSLARENLTQLTSEAQEKQVKKVIEMETNKPFLLSGDLMIRASYLELSEGNSLDNGVLLFSMHHIASDGWSMGILVNEFVSLYQSLLSGEACLLKPLEIQYADYAVWQRDKVAADELNKQIDYWQKQLDQIPDVHDLPLDNNRPEVKQKVGGMVSTQLSKVLSQNILSLANKQQVTPFMLLHAALALVLSRHSNSNDFVIGTPVANRPRQELESLIGFFVNTLVLRTNIEFEHLTDYLAHVKTVNQDALANQDIPFDQLLDKINVSRSNQYNPVFQIMFSMNTNEMNELSLPGLSFSAITSDSIIAKFDLTINAQLDDDTIHISWIYDQALFSLQTVEKLNQHFERVLVSMVNNPYAKLTDLEILSKAEKFRLVHELNNTQVEYPNNKLIHQLIEEQADKTPNNIAVLDEHQKLTYQEFERATNQLAHHLISLGVKPGDAVGLFMERSVDMMVALVATLKAGAAYVPFDPLFGTSRLDYGVKDAQIDIVICQSEIAQQLMLEQQTVIALDDSAVQTLLAGCSSDKPEVSFAYDGQDLVYIIYTSGSTGQPKGVEITHRGLVDYCYWGINNYYSETLSGARIISSVSFDGTVTSLYFPLLVGGCVELASPQISLDKFWSDLLNSQQALMIKITPSHIQGLKYADSKKASEIEHTFVIGGELLTRSTLSVIRDYFPGARFFHHYGPTETVVGSTLLDLDEYLNHSQDKQLIQLEGLPIGKPMGNAELYILNQHKQLQPFGTPGELYIGGEGLARGYLNLNKLTEERFIPHLFSQQQGARLYRTGDLVRYLADENIQFIGRIDNQVKIRGFRIEPGEIEQKLSRLPQVSAAAVIVKEDSNKVKKLVAYFVPTTELLNDGLDKKDIIGQVKQSLKSSLPDYMVPSALILLESFPLTPTAKIDRKALPEPDYTQTTEDYVGANNKTENMLVKIWAELLRIDSLKLSVNANFFELGGDSILSIQVVSRAAKAGLYFTAKDLFERQTIKELAAIVKADSAIVCPQHQITGQVELIPVQHRFFAREIALHHFNQSALLVAPENLRFEQLTELLEAIYLRHDALRLRFSKNNNKWQSEYKAFDQSMIQSSLSHIKLESDDFSGLTEVANEVQASFDLHEGPLLKLVYFTNKQNHGRILIVIHHLVIDGVSWRVLLEDIALLYRQQCENKKLTLAAKTSSYQQWSECLAEYAQSESLALEREHWINTLSTQIQPLPGKVNQSKRTLPYEPGESRFVLNTESTEKLLQQAGQAYRTQINELLLSSVLLGFYHWSGHQSIQLDLEGHGRESLSKNIDLSQTVGWFTCVYPLLLSADKMELKNVICAVKEACRAIPNNGIGYGILKYLKQDETLNQLSLKNKANILFNYLGQFDQVVNEESDFAAASESPGRSVSLLRKLEHELSFNGMVSAGQLSLSVSYDCNQYCSKAMSSLIENIHQQLESIINHCIQDGVGDITPSDFPLSDINQTMLNEWQEKYDIIDIYPTTGMQQGLLFHSALETSAYATQMQLTFDPGIDYGIFAKAWQQVVNRHDIFRTAFVRDQNNQLHQLVQKEALLPWEQIDLTHITDTQQIDNELTRLRGLDKNKGFDIDKAPLMRVTVFLLADGRSQFLWSHHHALTDGWCLPIIFAEVTECYRALMANEQPALTEIKPYKEFIRWLGQQNEKEAEAFWRDKLEDIDAPTKLPILEKCTNSKGAQSVTIELDQAATDKLVDMTKQCHTTINIALQAAWSYLLFRYSNETSVVFGATVSGRPPTLSGVEEMIGLFINTVPVRVNIPVDDSVESWLKQLHSSQVERDEYSYIPLSQIQRYSNCASGVPLFNSLVVFENYPVDDAIDEKVNNSGFDVSDVESFEGTNYDLSLVATHNKSLTVTLEYQSQLFDKSLIEHLLESLEIVLTDLANNPDKKVSKLPILSVQEKNYLLNELNNADSESKKPQCFHELFVQQAQNKPDNIALVIGGQEVTYRELDEQSTLVAQNLLSTGMIKGDLVGLSVERSCWMISGILGVLKAGGVYLPLDKKYPVNRLQYFIDDSELKFLLVEGELSDELNISSSIKRLDVESIKDSGCSSVKDNYQSFQLKSCLDNLAYVIYTSGSTGKPKGVMVQQAAISLHLEEIVQKFCFDDKQIVLQVASFNFDTFIEQSFAALISGAKLVVADSSLLDPEEFFKLMSDHKVTITDLSPAFLEELTHRHWSTLWQGLAIKSIVVGGEKIPRSLVQRWFDLPVSEQCDLYNAYGPTEAAITSTLHKLSRKDCERVSIGKALNSKNLYILNDHKTLMPFGYVGELYIGGKALAKGYLNAPVLTNERFIKNPLNSSDEVLYKTGDKVRYLNDGSLEFIERIDEQIKIRGFRIELGEIEHQLCAYSAVESAVVSVHLDSRKQKQLVAYIIMADASITGGQIEQSLSLPLRQHLLKQLPDYMVPTAFVVLNKLPLDANGKIDRKSLKAPDESSYISDYVAANSETEKQLILIWTKLLKITQKPLGITNNFFELGGHSLLAMRLLAEIRDYFKIEIPLKSIFENPEIKSLAHYIDELPVAQPIKNITPVERSSKGMPLSFSQQRLWFINQLQGGSIEYNMPNALRVEGDFNPVIAEQAIIQIIKRHESLRTNFHEIDGEAVQVVREQFDFSLQSFDLSAYGENERELQLKVIIEKISHYAFDLTDDLLLKAAYVLLKSGDASPSGVLIFNIHHIICDGWSMGLLVDEFVNCYDLLDNRKQDASPTLPIQYVDYAHWQRQWLSNETMRTQLDYWSRTLEDAPTCHRLPLDRPRSQAAREGGMVSDYLDEQTVDSIYQLLNDSECTLFMLMQSSLAIHIGRLSGESDVVLGAPNAGRDIKEVQKLIGLFLNTQVFRTQFDENTNFDEILKQTRQSHLEALQFNEVPFEAIVDVVNPSRSMEHSPIFQILINMNNNEVSDSSIEGITFSPMGERIPENKFDITLYIGEFEQNGVRNIALNWVYDARIFDHQRIEKVASEFNFLLANMVTKPQLPVTMHEWESEQDWPQLANTSGKQATDNIIGLFEHKAETNRDKVILEFSEESLTYQQLNERVNQLACLLVNRFAVNQSSRIAIAVSRGVERVVAILAVLKCGACYIPLSEELPAERLKFMIDDSQASLIVTDDSFGSQFDWFADEAKYQSLNLTEQSIKQLLAIQPTFNPVNQPIDQLGAAHIIYTSGSTGQPKGVIGSYQSTYNRISWMLTELPFEQDESMAHITSMAFIRGVWELLVPLCGGARLVLLPRQLVKQVDRLWEELNRKNVTRIVTAPSLMQALSETLTLSAVQFETTLRHWFVSGEPLLQSFTKPLLSRFNQLSIYNLYGSTEVMSDVLWSKVGKEESRHFAPVGNPISGVGVIIVGPHAQKVPDGVIGEILVYGQAVANGYTQDSSNKNAFINTQQGKAYKTGDLGFIGNDGQIECLGRADDQVKIRGHRIEIGEILYQLSTCKEVASCRIIQLEKEPGNIQLIAYVLPTHDIDKLPENWTNNIKKELARHLPSYMLPSAFIALEQWPLKPNGKIDKQALPAPDGVLNNIDYVAPATDTEKTLVEIWAILLKLDPSSISSVTRFFEIGGNSLLIIRLIAAIEKETSIRLAVAEAMVSNSIQEMSALVDHYLSNKRLKEKIKEQSSDEVERIKI